MKKIIAMISVLSLIFCVACAEEIDWSSMSDEEIAAVIEAGLAELDKRENMKETPVEDDTLASPGDYTTLEKGSKGDEVKALQQRLLDLYWLNGTADGDYGNKTKDAVERFQEASGLEVTGIADPDTQTKLFADDAPEAEMAVSCSVVGINNYSEAHWYVNGQEFTLKNSQTKTLNTPWGTYKFDAHGNYDKMD